MMCLVNEMQAQFFDLVIKTEFTFQKFKEIIFMPLNIISQLNVEYEKLRSPLNEEIAT